MPTRTLLLCTLIGACAPAPNRTPSTPTLPDSDKVGVLVMAHGGSAAWNRTVWDAVTPLSAELPSAVAFGMADPETLAAALDTLRAVGVTRVAVVRLFVSGSSFLDETRNLLGLSQARPETFAGIGHAGGRGPPVPIDHGLGIATHTDGLMVSPEAQRIISERVQAQSRNPPSESVLLLAHGMGSDDENARVHEAMEAIAAEVAKRPFASVQAETLREDWIEKRVLAENVIRSLVSRETAAGRRVIVVPLRLSGFGPYSAVLAGLEYTPTEGLLPHDAVADWIRNTASGVICSSDWRNPIGRCSKR